MVPFCIPFDLEVLLPKMHSSQNNPEKSYTERKAKHIPSGYACDLICSFDATKSKHDFGRGEDCVESLCKKFNDYVIEIIDNEEKEMILLTDEETKSYEEQKVTMQKKVL